MVWNGFFFWLFSEATLQESKRRLQKFPKKNLFFLKRKQNLVLYWQTLKNVLFKYNHKH